MREHARGRQRQRGAAAPLSRSRTSSPRRQQRQLPRANGGSAAAPPEVLRERVLADKNIDAGPPGASAVTAFRKRHEVAARPDVLTRYPFVDNLAATQGGGVGAVMHQATPTTPIQYLAKREIRRLAHEAFRELKASALGIRLSDLPCALQFLFFGDSASLLTAKGGGGGGGGGDGGGAGGARGAKRTAKDVHLVMALARECLPPTLAHAARDTSTLSTASTQGGAEAGWMRDGQNMFVSERRWIKVVAHVIRRLWDMDGRPEDVAAAAAQRRRRTITTTAAPGPSRTKPAAVAATAAPFGMEFQQPVWRPVGGRRGSAAAAAGGGAGGGRYLRGGEAANVTGAHSFLGGLEEDSRSDTTGWGGFSAASRISASDVDGGGGDDEALRAWEEAEDWVGAGRSIAWAPGEEQEEYAQGEAGGLFAAPRGLGAVHGSRHRRTQSGGGGAGSARRGGIAGARRSAVRDAVARRRLDRLDRGSSLLGDAAQGFPADGRSGVSGDGDRGDSSLAAEWDSNARGHTPGEHALDIAGTFLESSLMTRLAGGDWFDDEDAEETSAGSSAAWEP
ncbi:unnamed protein product [Ectocarpus fasciculatus]